MFTLRESSLIFDVYVPNVVICLSLIHPTAQRLKQHDDDLFSSIKDDPGRSIPKCLFDVPRVTIFISDFFNLNAEAQEVSIAGSFIIVSEMEVCYSRTFKSV